MGKKLFKKTLLLSDMDGTLLDSRHMVSDENVEALQRFVKQGGKFTLATGRMIAGVEPYLEKLPLNVPAILYNGALIYDFKKDKILWSLHLPESAEEIVEHLMQEYTDIGVEVFQGKDIYIVREDEVTEEHQRREGFKPIYVSLNEVPKPWYKVILAGEHKKLVEISEYVKSFLEDTRVVFSEPFFLEILHEDVSKGKAMAELQRIMGLEDYHVVAVGDNMNDMEMICAAGTGVAVGNAHGNLKNAADMLCCHNDEHAISEVIKWIEEGTI